MEMYMVYTTEVRQCGTDPQIKRPQVEMTDDLKTHIRQYANLHSVNLSRAFHALLYSGVIYEHSTFEEDANTDSVFTIRVEVDHREVTGHHLTARDAEAPDSVIETVEEVLDSVVDEIRLSNYLSRFDIIDSRVEDNSRGYIGLKYVASDSDSPELSNPHRMVINLVDALNDIRYLDASLTGSTTPSKEHVFDDLSIPTREFEGLPTKRSRTTESETATSEVGR